MKYIQRVVETKLIEYCQAFSVIGVTGPRQSGKSTLLQHMLTDYQYVTFDDFRTVNLLHNDPIKFINTYKNKVIFDEIQKVPEFFDLIKLSVDKDRKTKGKFILTGSSHFPLIKNSAESLAGRIGLLSLLPFQFSEIPKSLREHSIYMGGYPELIDDNYIFFNAWFSSYIETYLNKDVASVGNVGDIRDFRQFIKLLASNAAQQLNMSRYANDIGVDVKTIKRWIGILEASYIIFLIPPYFKNFGKRIVKSPKVYFYDTGFISFLTGIENKNQFENGPMTGNIFENYIVAEILKKELHNKTFAELYYLRTSNGLEVDLIIDRKLSKELIEIKSSQTFHPKMVASMQEFLEEGDKAYLLYRGENFIHPKPIQVLNYQNYLA